MLASRYLRGEMSGIRVLAQSGAMSDVLVHPDISSLFNEMASSRHSIEELLRTVRTSGVNSQYYALQTLTAPSRVTAQMQKAVEGLAICRFVDLSVALEAGIVRGNELVELMCCGDESGR